MTFFEQELRRLFDHDTVFADARFVGNACYGRLTDNIRVKINFTDCKVKDNYDALKVTILNRNEGQIDSMVLRFRDLWGMKQTSNPNFREGVSPHLWVDYGKARWYVYKPNQGDYKQLSEAVRNYVEVFQEPELQQKSGLQMGQSMG